MTQSNKITKEFGALNINGSGIYHLGIPNDGFNFVFDGTTTLNIDPQNANDVFRVGETTVADVQFDGASADLLWDGSANTLQLGGASILHLGATGDGFNASFDGTTTLNIDPVNANDVLRVGETVLADVQFDGATDLLWDASVGSLANGGFLAPFIINADSEIKDAGNETDLSVANTISYCSTDAGGDAHTLPNGTVIGQIKVVIFVTDGTGNLVINPTTYADGTNITFADANDFAVFMWAGALGWRTIANVGGTIA